MRLSRTTALLALLGWIYHIWDMERIPYHLITSHWIV